jgi:hypothetical protein
VDGVIVVATLTGGSGETVAGEITAAVAGAVTAGVEIAGTTAGVETAVKQVMAAGDAVAMLGGGTIDPTIIAVGTDETATDGGTIDLTVDARAAIGHETCAGDETNITEPSAVAPNARVNFGYTRSQNRYECL